MGSGLVTQHLILRNCYVECALVAYALETTRPFQATRGATRQIPVRHLFPLPGNTAFERLEVRFVRHLPAVPDPVTQIEVGEAELAASFDLS